MSHGHDKTGPYHGGPSPRDWILFVFLASVLLGGCTTILLLIRHASL